MPAMIVPSIDLQGGQAVQLIGGETKALDAGDPRPLARRFGLVGEIAVVDLDAALGQGSNAAVIEELIDLAPCRVGGGIRDAAGAISWLDRGAHKVVLGTAARPEVLRALPRERAIAALDARHGEVVVEGWRTRTGQGVLERLAELRDLVGGFLVTFVEREGRLAGTDLAFAKEIRAAAGDAAVTIAGGITTAEEIAELDRLGCDAQVGMALYTGRLGLAEAFAAPLQSDRPDGLWPTVVVDERGVALGFCHSDLEFAARRPGARPGRLPLAHARPVDQGRDVGRHPGAGADRRRLRSRLPALHGAPAAARLLSSGHAHLLGRGRRARRARPPPRRAQEIGARGLLHRPAARRSGAARGQAARGSGRAGRGRDARRTRSTRPRTCSISRSRRSPATTSTSPRSSARLPAGALKVTRRE